MESEILRDLLYVFQGIDGRYLKFDPRADAFVLDPNVVLPRPTSEIVNKLTELGWLYFRIQQSIQARQGVKDAGLIAQVSFVKLMLLEFLFSYQRRAGGFLSPHCNARERTLFE